MSMHVSQRTHHARAFSILELLLVLVILAVLSAIVGVRFAGQSSKAKVTAANAQLSDFKTALGAYELQVGSYPTTQQGLESLIEEPSNAEGWSGPYLETDTVPKDQWGNEWQYRYPGTHNPDSFDLFSPGPDGREGGGDDIANWTSNK
ncbi:MAG: type II secretion system major pseudopilin GspG [Phycisphaerales bacterium]